MLLLLSPAKTMNFSDNIPSFLNSSKPVFFIHSEILNKILKTMDSMQLKTALNISDKQIQRVKNSIHNFSTDTGGRQALYAYRGAVYKAIDALSLNMDQINFAQRHILIFSGLYGILKPLDLINEYRLDMKSRIKLPNSSSLYKYWGNIISGHLAEHYKNETLINLASDEFSKVIDSSLFKAKTIKIYFSELSSNKRTSPPMYSKIARGKMTGFIIRNFLTSPEQIKKFDLDGYSFNNYLSTELKYIFTRRHP